MEELDRILARFAASGWDLIAVPARQRLDGNCERETPLPVIRQTEQACGSCGCDLDPLYRRTLKLL